MLVKGQLATLTLASVAASIFGRPLTPMVVKAGTVSTPPSLPSAPSPPARPEATVAFTTIDGGVMLLRVHLAGAQGRQADATFLLDTGSGNCYLADRLADKLGLPQTPALGPGGRPQLFLGRPARQVTVPLLALGGLQAPDAQLVVADAETFTNLLGRQAAGVDGVIGGNFLRNNAAVIDPQYKLIGFFNHTLTPADIGTVGMAQAVEVPLRERAGLNTYTCRARMAGGGRAEEADLMVDTGSDLTQVPAAAAQRLGLTARATPGSAALVAGSRGIYKTLLPSLTVLAAGGGVDLGILPVFYPRGKFPDYAPPALGMDVFSRFRVLLDFPDRKMYLLPVQPTAAVSPLASPAAPAPPVPKK